MRDSEETYAASSVLWSRGSSMEEHRPSHVVHLRTILCLMWVSLRTKSFNEASPIRSAVKHLHIWVIWATAGVTCTISRMY